MSEKIKVVMLEPGKEARIEEIEHTLENMQHIVGGLIEGFYPFDEPICFVVNDSGKIDGLPLNRAFREEAAEIELSYADMTRRFREAERYGRHLEGYVVFTKESFLQDYPVESRTYRISSQNKAFKTNMGGYSIYASSLDGSDCGVRLDCYMADEHGGKDGWQIERCYMKEPGGDIIDIIAGTCFICDCSGEDFGSLTDEQCERFRLRYQYPERFVRTENGIMVIPYIPRTESI